MEMDKPSLKRRISASPKLSNTQKKIRGAAPPAGSKDMARTSNGVYSDSHYNQNILHRPPISSTNGYKSLNETRHASGSPLANHMESSHKDVNVRGRENKADNGPIKPSSDRRATDPRVRPTMNTNVDSAHINSAVQTPNSSSGNHTDLTNSGRSTPAPVAIMTPSSEHLIKSLMRCCTESAVAYIRHQDARSQLDLINKELKSNENVLEKFPAYQEQRRNEQATAAAREKEHMSEVVSLQEQQAKLATEFTRLIQPDMALIARCDKLEKQLQSYRSEQERSQQNIQKNQAETTELNKLIDRNDQARQREDKHLMDTVATLRKDTKDEIVKTKDFVAEAARKACKDEIKGCTHRIEKLELGSQQVWQQIDGIRGSLSKTPNYDALKETIEQSNDSVQTVRSDVSQMKNEMSKRKNQTEEFQHALKSTVKSLENVLQQLPQHETEIKRLSTRMTEVGAKTERNESLAPAVREYEAKLGGLAEKLNFNFQSIEKINAKLEEQDQRKQKTSDSFINESAKSSPHTPANVIQSNSSSGQDWKSTLAKVKSDLDADVKSVEDMTHEFINHTAKHMEKLEGNHKKAVSEVVDRVSKLSKDHHDQAQSFETLKAALSSLASKIEVLESREQTGNQHAEQSAQARLLDTAVSDLHEARRSFVELKTYSEEHRQMNDAILVNTTACRMLEERYNHLTTDALFDGIMTHHNNLPLPQIYNDLQRRVHIIENEGLRNIQVQHQQLYQTTLQNIGEMERKLNIDQLKTTIEGMKQAHDILASQVKGNTNQLMSTPRSLELVNNQLPKSQQVPAEYLQIPNGH